MSYRSLENTIKFGPVEENGLEENKLYHVSWGPGVEHQVVAKHGEEAVSKAKAAIIKKVPKLKDKKYAGTFSKAPRVHNLSHERKVQKEEVDYEGQMARAQLQMISKRAAALAEMMTDDMQLEAWVQSKITTAEDYVTTVHDYMTTRKGK